MRKGEKLQFLLITNLTHFFQCIYFPSLHVSSNPVPIIRRIKFCQYTIWYMSHYVGDCLVCRSGRTGIPGSHLNRLTYTRWRIDKICKQVNMEHQLDATITVLLIFKISSTCFGQAFAHLQERKTEFFLIQHMV
jgi:hypothetical protein